MAELYCGLPIPRLRCTLRNARWSAVPDPSPPWRDFRPVLPSIHKNNASIGDRVPGRSPHPAKPPPGNRLTSQNQNHAAKTRKQNTEWKRKNERRKYVGRNHGLVIRPAPQKCWPRMTTAAAAAETALPSSCTGVSGVQATRRSRATTTTASGSSGRCSRKPAESRSAVIPVRKDLGRAAPRASPGRAPAEVSETSATERSEKEKKKTQKKNRTGHKFRYRKKKKKTSRTAPLVGPLRTRTK